MANDGGQPRPELAVARWTDYLSALQARWPRLFIAGGNLESRMLGERLADLRVTMPVFVSGLARCGTTILLELLARHPEAATHRYRDFPPVLVPWYWNRFLAHAGARDQAPAERAHGDGILVTAESPEAFEEVVWMAFFPALHDPARSAVLGTDTSHPAFERFYREHLRKLLLVRGGSRYVAKANYHLTRLRYLLKLFPDARFVVPVRDPAAHIASLARQHERFCREHARDPRLMRHMSRSGHFEFGQDRRPVNTGDATVTREILARWARGEEIEGWALYWNDVYGHVADVLEADRQVRAATLVVAHETLCRQPRETMRRVLGHCGLLAGGDALPGLAARTLRPPSAREPFDAARRHRIAGLTGATLARLERLAATDAAPGLVSRPV